nr:tyrosine-type recombinase/integrase [Pirellula staleyi]
MQKLEINETRAKRPTKLPVMLTVEEVRRVLPEIPLQPFRLMARLIYGAGLRLMEACRLRVQDVDFDRLQLMMRDGKGEKDRAVPLPGRLVEGLLRQLETVERRHELDLEAGAGWAWLP